MNALWLPWNLIYISLYEAAKRRIYYWQLGKMRRQGDAAAGVTVSQVGAQARAGAGEAGRPTGGLPALRPGWPA